MIQRFLAFFVTLTLALPAISAPWLVDKATSQITFRVGYLNGGNMVVEFPDYDMQIDFDPNHPERTKALITVRTAAVNSRLPPVDDLVRSSGYLDAASFPTITFNLKGMKLTSNSTADLTGSITVRGITRPIALKASVYKFDQSAASPTDRVAAFEITGTMDRTDFGSTAGVPQIDALLPIRILLEMHPEG
jgi:polyisoprenoid-binding protein YceI